MKTYKNQSVLLDKAIDNLKLRRSMELENIKYNFQNVCSSLKPGNIINQALVDLNNTPNLKTNLFDTVISLTGGYFSKKLIPGSSSSWIKKMLGYVVQYGVTNLIAKKVSKD